MARRGLGILPSREGAGGDVLQDALLIGSGVLLVAMIANFRVPILPSIGNDLSMTAGQLGLATSAFAAGRLAMDVPAGRGADRFPAALAIGTAAVVTAAASLVMVFVTTSTWMYVAFAFLGAGSALSNTTGMTYFSSLNDAASRGRTLALYSGSRLVGQALGPMLSGLIAGWLGWRSSMGAAAAMSIVIGVVLLLHRGSTVVAGEAAPREGVAAAAEDARPPLSRLQVWVVYSIPFAMFYTFGGIAQTLVPIVGEGRLGLGAGAIGLALGLAAVCRFVGTFLGGYVSDHGSRKLALIPGLLALAAGVLLLGTATSVVAWLVSIVVMSLASYPGSVGATILADHASPGEAGRVLGPFRFVGDVGLLVGPGVAGMVYESAGGTGAVLVNAVLLVAVAAASLLLLPGDR